MSAATGSHTTQHTSKIAWGWWILFFLGLFVAIVSIIVWMGATNAADGDPLLENPGALVLALISGVTSIAALVIPKLSAIGNNTAQTAQHVVNSHTERNMRDDIDELKRGVDSLIILAKSQGQRLSDQSRDILGIRQELGQIRQTERDQWEAIEDTDRKIRGNRRGERNTK